MDYNEGRSFGYDQYYADPAYLENPIATTSELLKRNAQIAKDERFHSHKIKSLSEQEIEDIIQQELRDKVRRHVEQYFDNKNGEVDYPNTLKNRKLETFEDMDDEHPKCYKKYKSIDTQLILMVLIIVLFVLSIFQYAQTQSLRDTLHNLLHSSNPTLAKLETINK